MRKRSCEMRSLLVVALVVAGTLAGASTDAKAQFGIASLSGTFATTQAGAHSDFSTSLALNRDALGNPEGQLKTATFMFPAGSVGNPQAVEQCTVEMLEQLECARTSQVGELNLTAVRCPGVVSQLQAPTEAGARRIEVSNAQAFCTEEGTDVITIGKGSEAETVPIASIVNGTTLELAASMEHSHQAGEDVTHIADIASEALPLYNIRPSSGHVATFAAALAAPLFIAEVFIDVSVGESGRLTATITETSTVLQIVSSTVTLWGVPAAAGHDAQRCNELFECGPSGAEPAAFMTNPTSCTEAPQEAVTATSWQGQSATSIAQLPSLSGCEQLNMAPSLAVTASTARQDSPAGYAVVVRVPQDEGPYGLATPALEGVSVRLPQGTSLSPGLANGLQACEPAQLRDDRCPDASRIGAAEIVTPLLSEPLKGALYIGTPTPTERYRVFLRVSAGSTVIDLQGVVEANEETGQVSTVFQDLPEVPFVTLRLSFFGGAAAALANPVACGPATSSGSITSYAGQIGNLSSTFEVNEDAEGGACQATLPFMPRFTAGTTDPLAGHTSSFILSVSRGDGQQNLSSFTAHLPPGLIGLMSSVPLCREPAAREGTCTQGSAVGTATVAAGAGPLPLVVSGPVYLTGPYDGAPFGLDIVIKATAGPFDLGTALVRSRILLNPRSLALTIASDTLPDILGGIPLRVRTVDVNLDRSGLIVNPTSCASQMVTATINSSQGAAVPLSTPFEVAGCVGLAFKPRLAASTHAKASQQGDGASLDIDVFTPAREGANIRSVRIQMPAQLRPRLTTIQHACVPTHLSSLMACPAESRVGHATVTSPATLSPLSGPIYLVAQGSNTLPSLVMLLQSEGIVVKLEGMLNVSRNDVISATFTELPDVPVSSFDLQLPRGPYSMLGAISSLCSKRMSLPYIVTDQSGAKLRGTAAIAVRGCSSRKAKVKAKQARLSGLSARERRAVGVNFRGRGSEYSKQD
jgi:hypothetical protein